MSISIQPQNINGGADYSQMLLTGQKSQAIQNLKSAYAMVRTTPHRQVEPEKSKSILIVDVRGRLTGLSESLSHNPAYSVWTADSDKTASEIASTIHLHLVISDLESAQALGECWSTAIKAQGAASGPPAVLILSDSPEQSTLPAFENCSLDWFAGPVEDPQLTTRIDFLLGICDQVTQLRKVNAELQAEIDQKQRELFLHLELLMHAGGVKDKMLESINKLVPYLNMEGRSKLNTLVKQLRWELNDEANINFVRAFDDLNAKFYANLEQTCSLITRGEKRLCAFVVKGHSSSEIARITRKSQNSINVAFSRLRAKLGLSNSKDLRSFLERLFMKSGNKPSLSAAQFLIS
jgi:DNA-binding response OmpR family regulator/DNA-binding CsgD family transcriptional regulator